MSTQTKFIHTAVNRKLSARLEPFDSQNIDHFYTVTEYSITQLLQLGGFEHIKPFPLKLYVFWGNPLNYLGLALTMLRVILKLYGKKVVILSKKIGAVGYASQKG